MTGYLWVGSSMPKPYEWVPVAQPKQNAAFALLLFYEPSHHLHDI